MPKMGLIFCSIQKLKYDDYKSDYRITFPHILHNHIDNRVIAVQRKYTIFVHKIGNRISGTWEYSTNTSFLKIQVKGSDWLWFIFQCKHAAF